MLKWFFNVPLFRYYLRAIKVRHLIALVEYSTPRKICNLLRIETQRMFRLECVGGYPYTMYFDTINRCNLRCPLCPTGRKDLLTRPGMSHCISFDRFKEVIDEFVPYLFIIHLYLWGEPLLNKDIFKIIRYAHDKNICTNLSTNANLLDTEKSEALVKSGLDHLAVSISGIEQETYVRYHVGGNIDVVMQNLLHLHETKKRMKSRKPFIELQYILFEHNQHEVEEAKRRARKCGVENILIRNTWSDNYDIGLKKAKHEVKEVIHGWGGGEVCRQLYNCIAIEADGGVYPCCRPPSIGDFGSIFCENYSTIRNNDSYRAARKIFRTRCIKGFSNKIICAHCNVATKYVEKH